MPPLVPPPSLYSELDARLPIVMLPVRLETRYFDAGGGQVELRVRVFPSGAHVTTDKPGVDPFERDQTVAYWSTRHEKGDQSAATDSAWQRLTRLFGAPRAQWLRLLLTPTVGPDGTLSFPAVPLNPVPETGETPLLNSEATGLPSRFLVAGYEGATRVFAVIGEKVPAAVTVGPLAEPEAIRWQTDFAAAEAIGLGVRVKLPRARAAAMTRLAAFGVREGAGAAGSTRALESLLERHSRDSGAGLLTAGTPTNHTSTSRVGALPEATGAAPAPGTDGARLGRALGVEPTALALVSGAEASTDAPVEAMHSALWPATLGYFLEQLMSPLFSEAAVSRGRTLYQRFVRPRGPFPVLSLGEQPYGVLPVSSIASWRVRGTAGQPGVESPLAKALNALRAEWLRDSSKVPRLAGEDPGGDLAAILSQSPFSTRWLARTLESQVVAQRGFGGFDVVRFQTVIENFRRQRLTLELVPLGLAGEPKALDMVFQGSNFALRVPPAAPPGTPKDAPLPLNYIEGIASATVEALKAHDVPGAAPRTLLYILLRHATLLVMAKAADRVLAQPALLERDFVEPQASTVWARLSTPVASLNNRTPSQLMRGPTANVPGLKDLGQHRRMLGMLARLPVGELDRLTAEGVDSASHRLDAWITALASERLAAMREATPQGAHLGAYAWVDAPPVPAVLAREGQPPIVDPDSQGFIHAPRLAQARTAAVLRGAFLAREHEAAQAPLVIDLSSDRVRAARQLLEGVRNGATVAALLGEKIERWMVEAGLGPRLPDLRRQFAIVDGSGRTRINGIQVAESWRTAPPANLRPVPERLADLVDAVGDLLLAEAVHQQSAGNPGRAQPALAALDTGLTLPEEFDVVRTEADATARTWRVVLPVAPDDLDVWVTKMIRKAAGPASGLTATVGSSTDGGTPATHTLASIGVKPAQLMDFVQAGVEAPALVTRFLEAAGGSGPVQFSESLTAALRAASAIARLLRGARPLQDGDLGVTGEPLAELGPRSRQKEWMHDLSRVRASIAALDELDFLVRARSADTDLGLHFRSGGTGLALVMLADPPASGATTGLLIDGWIEATPGLEATTGIAMHYDAPRARAPQAILVMVPPDPVAGWNAASIEASVLETADLARIRMVRPADVHGSFLPALYFADNLAADTVSTDFLVHGFVAQFTDLTQG
ncbi:MAG: hypothetical protein ACOYN0_05275 [Phycisphaerales bacterium]